MNSGQPFQVIIGNEASALERAAAADLQRCLSEATGVSARLSAEAQATAAARQFLLGTPATNQTLIHLVRQGKIQLGKGQTGSIKTLRNGDCQTVVLAGATPWGVSHATYEFLERHIGVGFFLDGDHVPRLEGGDFSDIDETVTPAFELRAYLSHPFWVSNFRQCCRLWGFAQWKELIDWMRRKRFNCLPLFHDEGTHLWGEAVFRAFPEIPKTQHTLAKFAVLPESREELNKKIFAYARENGIAVAYNLFYPQVPDFFPEFYSDLTYHEVSMDSVGICAAQPQARDILGRLYGELIATYGLDDGHIFIVCPYQHERPLRLCGQFASRAEPAAQVIELIRELDPKARLFIETWCWRWDEQPAAEWQAFLSRTDDDVGVADWDCRYPFQPETATHLDWYAARPWLQLVHTTMEGTNPPSCIHIKPQAMIDIFRQAAEHGAVGLGVFNILAGSDPLLADLGAALGWRPDVARLSFFADYLRRRYGDTHSAALAESYHHWLEAVDRAALLPGNPASAEGQLRDQLKNPPVSKEWLVQQIQQFRERLRRTEEACQAARSVPFEAPLLRSYLDELQYLRLRWQGIIALYSGQVEPTRAERQFAEAVRCFSEVVDLLSSQYEDAPAGLERQAPDVQFSPHFIADPTALCGWWRKKGFLNFFHVTPNTLNEMAAGLRRLASAGNEP